MQLKSYFSRVRRRSGWPDECYCPSARALVVAKDVLAAISAGRFRVEQGAYVDTDVPGTSGTSGDSEPLRENLRRAALRVDAYDSPKDECRVCALGACFVAMIDRGTIVRDDTWFDDRDDLYRELQYIFTPEEFDLIEEAFELGSVRTDISDSLKARRARNFGRRRKDPVQRLEAIMQNIVDNGGEFIPPTKYTDPLSKSYRGE